MPFASLVPTIVLVFGLIAALAIAAIGVNQLKLQTDHAAALRSRLLSHALAGVLSKADMRLRESIVEQASIGSGAELILVKESGRLLVDGSVRPPPEAGITQLLVVREGVTETSLGRARFTATRLDSPHQDVSVISFVLAPSNPIAIESMVRSVAAYSAILLGIAALVAFALARDVHADVVYLTRRVRDMARVDSNPTGAPIAVRTIDDVGAMTNAFNDLVKRFADAQRSYRDDLSLAVSIESDKSAFLAALSHELKTPLNVILGFADVLLAEVEGPLTAEAKECLTTIRGSGAHLKALIKDILDLSALESGEMTLARGLTNVYVIATNVLAEHRVAAQEKNLELRIAGEAAVAWADPLRIRQIVGNLVSNAVKFTQRGHVEVRIERHANAAVIIVSDTGPGIALGDQNAVFEDFSQVGDLKARGAGTGLGLAITRRLVGMHGGRITLRSELGKGATFEITLPNGPPSASPSDTSVSDTARRSTPSTGADA
jgi:signal transduction histidine kinase